MKRKYEQQELKIYVMYPFLIFYFSRGINYCVISLSALNFFSLYPKPLLDSSFSPH